jgi:hypothetical protein
MDIVEKLRFYVTGRYDIDAAADEIERLREALREIEILEVDPRSSGQMWVETLKEVARKALGEKE